MSYPPEFTIAYVVHADLPLLDLTIPSTLDTLCGGTARSYDLVLVIDGADTAPVGELLTRARGVWGFDEVRVRSRSRHCAGGDPSNNGHAHLVCDKSRFLITVEGDVVAFRTVPGVDVLDLIARTFERCPEMALAYRMDDHDCWEWKLRDQGPPFAPGIRSVNRVASHFLVYDTTRARPVMARAGGIPGDRFHDGDGRWFNYEDWLSGTFAVPAGPGIGYLEDLPIEVYHCDRKLVDGSAYYQRDLATRLQIFEERRRSVPRAEMTGVAAPSGGTSPLRSPTCVSGNPSAFRR